MYSATFISCQSTTPFLNLLQPSHHSSFLNPTYFPSPSNHTKRCHPTRANFTLTPSLKPLNPLRHSAHNTHQFKPLNKAQNALNRLAKPVVYTLFWIAVGLTPIRGFQFPAIAAAPAALEEIQKAKSKDKGQKGQSKSHEYSDCTKRLLETVSGLIKVIEEVRNGNVGVKSVEIELKKVKSKRKELQEEIMSGLYAELRVLNGEKEELKKWSELVVDKVLKANREREILARKGGGEERIVKLEEETRSDEKEYDEIWDKIGEIEDHISRRETIALSIGVRELSSIEKECEKLVESVTRKMRQKAGNG